MGLLSERSFASRCPQINIKRPTVPFIQYDWQRIVSAFKKLLVVLSGISPSVNTIKSLSIDVLATSIQFF